MGNVLPFTVLLPSGPEELAPQHLTRLAVVRAQVRSSPTLIAAALVISDFVGVATRVGPVVPLPSLAILGLACERPTALTGVGCHVGQVEPVPCAPAQVSPQHHTVPTERTAQVK